ncbi:MAG: hypothetical protein AMXMBFR67_15950 [Nitrospira sp.]
MVKWTQPFEVLTGPGECHMLPYDLGDVDTLFDPTDDIVRNEASAHGGPPDDPQEPTPRVAQVAYIRAK